ADHIRVGRARAGRGRDEFCRCGSTGPRRGLHSLLPLRPTPPRTNKVLSAAVMNRAVFSFPTTTLFGPGALAELPNRLAATTIQTPLVATDPALPAATAFQPFDPALWSEQQAR